MSAETKQELTLVELYLKNREQRKTEFLGWLAEAFQNAFGEEK